MSSRHLLDPDLVPLIAMGEMLTLSDDALPAIRANFGATTVLADTTDTAVTREDIAIPGVEGPDVRCLVYKPKAAQSGKPGYVHIHGGGYILGTPDMADEMNIRIATDLGCVVVSVDYRLAPEHPIPAPLDDCYAGLAWLHQNATELGVNPDRIAIGGESAGGGLAAALALKARDLGEYAICHQQLTYPMLDDRTGTSEAPGDPLVGEFVWTREANQFGWSRYLGDAPKAAPQVPARAESLADLPNTWLLTAGLDLFRDENIAYAQRLMGAGVITELVVVPAACHGFQGIPGSALQARYIQEFMSALKRGLGA